MKRPDLIYILLCGLLVNCHKPSKTEPAVDTPPPVITVDSASACLDLPATPVPFGWTDSTTDENKNINAFIYNPLNPDEVICRVNGDLYGFNQVFNLNLITKKSIPIGGTGYFLPQINKNGWIVFSSPDNTVYKVKANGDSLSPLTSGKTAQDPKWDYTGNYIYYYQQAFSTISSQLMKISSAGMVINSVPTEIPYTAVFKKSDKIIYLRTSGSTVYLILHDMGGQGETTLLSGPYNSKDAQIYFDDLCLDNNDENLYWANKNGIYKCNLQSLIPELILKNCPNRIYDNPIISFKPDELTLSCHIIKVLSPTKLLHEYKTYELNLQSRELTEVRVFP